MLKFYEQDNRNHLALYLGLGVHAIHAWNRNKPKKFELVINGWNNMCKVKTNADIPKNVILNKKGKYVRTV